MPITLVINFYKKIEDIQIMNMNLNSKTSAIGWSYLMSGFGDNKVDYLDLLPIAIEDSTAKQLKEGYNKPSQNTLDTLKRLISQKRVPLKVLKDLIGTGLGYLVS